MQQDLLKTGRYVARTQMKTKPYQPVFTTYSAQTNSLVPFMLTERWLIFPNDNLMKANLLSIVLTFFNL